MKPEETNIRYKYARSYIPNAVFYIPFGYYFYARLGTVTKLLSWMLIYLMPTAFYASIGYEGSWGTFVTNYLLILVATFSLYEYGYIYNDTIAIRREQQPAIRLYDDNFRYFHRWHYLIVGVRILYSVAVFCALYIINEEETSTLLIALSIGLMCLLFSIYNTWRSRWNVWLYPFLVCSRYLPFMFMCAHGWWPFVLLFLSFPCLNALERFSMPRYRWSLMRLCIPNEESKTLFRVAYYAILLLVLVPVFYYIGQNVLLLTPIFILAIYRFVLFFWLKYHNPTNYLNG